MTLLTRHNFQCITRSPGGSRSVVNKPGGQKIIIGNTDKVGAPADSRAQGLSSLTDDDMEVLSWSRAKRLEEFQKVNQTLSAKVLETKLLYIDTITVDNGEILDVLRLNPDLSWEKVRDMFMGGPVEGYTSTFHNLDDIEYPASFWKAIIENEREKL